MEIDIDETSDYYMDLKGPMAEEIRIDQRGWQSVKLK